MCPDSRFAELRRQRRSEKLGTIIANEMILEELRAFLNDNFSVPASGSLLDIGAGTKPYARLYEPYFARTVSIDVERSPHDIADVSLIASADDMPFEDASFDCVLCTEVLEHCSDPGAVLAEIRRVLRPGGLAFVSTPFLVALHEMPYDFYRFTPSALRHLAAGAKFEVERLEPRGEYVAVALGILLLPTTKAWQLLSKGLGLNLYRPGNPIVALTVVAPQRFYVWAWRGMRRSPAGRLRRTYDKLSYYTLGYITHLRRLD